MPPTEKGLQVGDGGALVEWFQRVSEKRRAEGAEQEEEGEGCRETQRGEVRAGRKGDGTWARWAARAGHRGGGQRSQLCGRRRRGRALPGGRRSAACMAILTPQGSSSRGDSGRDGEGSVASSGHLIPGSLGTRILRRPRQSPAAA